MMRLDTTCFPLLLLQDQRLVGRWLYGAGIQVLFAQRLRVPALLHQDQAIGVSHRQMDRWLFDLDRRGDAGYRLWHCAMYIQVNDEAFKNTRISTLQDRMRQAEQCPDLGRGDGLMNNV